MKIEVHTLIWHEPDKLRIFLPHYCEFADRVVIWNYGEPGSALKQVKRYAPVAEAKEFPQTDGFLLQDAVRFRRNCWTGTDADWVIIVDPDEWLYHSYLSLRSYLSYTPSDVSLIKCVGFNCFGPIPAKFDTGLWRWCVAYAKQYCKTAIFRPVEGLRFTPGGHEINADEDAFESNVILFHGAHLGSSEAIAKRAAAIDAIRSPQEEESRIIHHVPHSLAQVEDKRCIASKYGTMPVGVALHVRDLYSRGVEYSDIVRYLQSNLPEKLQEAWSPGKMVNIFGPGFKMPPESEPEPESSNDQKVEQDDHNT